MAITGSLNGIGVTGASYEFTVKNLNMIPEEGVIVITVPTGVTVVDNASDFEWSCESGCNTSPSGVSFDWNSGDRTLTITNVFLGGDVDDFKAGQTIIFTITGWTNPTDSQDHDFIVTTKFTLDDTTYYDIEIFTGMSISASEGEC